MSYSSAGIQRNRVLYIVISLFFLTASQNILAESLNIIRAEKTLRYDAGGLVLNVGGKKNLVMLVLSFSGLTKQDPTTYIVDASNPNVKYESSTSLWFPKQKIQEDTFQLSPNVKSFRLHAGGKLSKRFTIEDKINKSVKAGAALK